jgi:hypothetical protein
VINVNVNCGLQIYRASAGNVKRTPEEIAADPEEEDEYGYTASEYKTFYIHHSELTRT